MSCFYFCFFLLIFVFKVLGYSVNGQTLDVWVHATNYNHYINSVLLGTTYAVLKSDIQVEMPNNYQIIE